MKVTVKTNVKLVHTIQSPKDFGSGTGSLGDKRMRGDHSDYSIIEIGQNTEKSLGDLRRLVVTQTPVKDYQLRLVGKLTRSKKWLL